MESEDPVLARYNKWLAEDCGAEKWLPNVFWGNFDHGGKNVRGLGVTRDVAKGEEVMCVSRKCRISAEVGVYPTWLRGVILAIEHENGASFDAHVMLGLMAGEELAKGNESFWAPYFDFLPKKDDYRQFHPYYLDDVDIGDANYVSGYRKTALADYELYRKSIKELGCKEPVTEEHFWLGYMYSLTRSFSVAGIVPWTDAVNTDEGWNVQQTWGDDEMDMFCLVSNREIKKGEELMCDYDQSKKTPLEMFMIYGFSLPKNAHNNEYVEYECGHLLPHLHNTSLVEGTPTQRNLHRFIEAYCVGHADGEL